MTIINKKADCCVVIPAYCEERRIAKVVQSVKAYIDCVVVVDDGSNDNTAEEATSAGAVVVKLDYNSGKGVALESGFKWAHDNGYEFLITMDGDGQHAAEDLPSFLSACKDGKYDVLIGNRMWNSKEMPFVRRITNKVMSWLLSRKMKQKVPDTQSGYRLYKCSVIKDVKCRSLRFNAESEILMILAMKSAVIGSVPIKVIYGDEKSKINPVKDTVRFFRMLRKFRKENRK